MLHIRTIYLTAVFTYTCCGAKKVLMEEMLPFFKPKICCKVVLAAVTSSTLQAAKLIYYSVDLKTVFAVYVPQEVCKKRSYHKAAQTGKTVHEKTK